MKKNIKWILSGAIVITLGVGTYFFYKKQKQNEIVHEPKEKLSPFKSLKYAPKTQRTAKYFLQQPKGKTKADLADQEYFKKLLNDPLIDHFFHYTLSFFDNKPEGYAAARFVALSMKFDSQTPEHIRMMEWTRSEIQKNSKHLYATILNKRSEIFKNTYFHNRILNLVHQLEVNPSQKLEIYSDTIVRPLEVDADQKLSSQSNVIEVALILARQSIHDPGVIAPVVSKAIEVNSDAYQKEALKARVLNQYPMLNYLF